jgi:hypothetical protein
MAGLLQPYSLVIVAVILLVVFSFVLIGNKKPRPADWLALGGIALALFAVWLTIRPLASDLPDDATAVQKMIGAGKPVLLEFQSPY